VTEFQSTLWTVIRGAKRGDEAALREFVLRYRAPIVRYCMRRGLKDEAEDLAQEILMRLFQQGVLRDVDPSRGKFRSLLIVVARNVIANHIKGRQAQKRGGGKVKALGDRDVASPGSDEEFDREWVAHLIEVALARLAREHENYHAALRRFLLGQMSYEDIAESLGKSKGEVRNFIHRGKKKLVEYLRDQVRDYSTSRADYEDELKYLSRFLPE
jgi:RNA polymerase sigma-70 factor (ECF subfamily)